MSAGLPAIPIPLRARQANLCLGRFSRPQNHARRDLIMPNLKTSSAVILLTSSIPLPQ